MRFPSMVRRLRNTQGGIGSTARSASTPYSEPPVADAGSDQCVAVGDTVTFDGSGSTGSNLTYSWDFGADATPASGSGVTPSCTYSRHGDKTVKLTVSYTGTDGKKVKASDTLKVTVISMKSQTVNDGESPVFSVLGLPSVLDPRTTTFSWGWSISAPKKSGNNPAVVFLPPKPTEPPNTTTIDRAKWFAFPNRTCPLPDRASIAAFLTSTYTIRCTVTTSNGSATVEAGLSVSIPKTGGDTVSPSLVDFSYYQDSENLWRLNPNTIRRTLPQVNISLPLTRAC